MDAKPTFSRASAASSNVAGACIVRDASDIIPLLCGHYLRVGLAHVAFIDDGSTDGTFEFLRSLSKLTTRISVRRVFCDRFEQRKLMNEAVNSLIQAGYQIVLPFDADEFWDIDAKNLAQRYKAEPERIFFGRWVNFVQGTNLKCPRPFGLFHIRYHAIAMDDATQETVTAFHRPFVCHSDTKVAFKTSKTLQLQLGQHQLDPKVKTNKHAFEIFHIPLRYRSEIEKRGLNYEPRRALIRTDPGQSWQSAFHRDVVTRKRVDEVWKANSACRAGYIVAHGKPFPLVPDIRLRRLLLKASLYLAWSFRMIAV